MEKKSKLVLAVLQGSDSDNTIRNLNERGFMVTVLSSTGGFLKKKSTTVMIDLQQDFFRIFFAWVLCIVVYPPQKSNNIRNYLINQCFYQNILE